MSSNRISPNQREVLSAVSTITNKQEYLTSTGNILNVNASVSISGVSTAANQTNGAQKTQLVDGSGNVISSTGNALDVNIKSGSPSSVVSTANSSTATLLSGAVFTGTSEDVTTYAEMRVSVFADQASATDGLSFQQSSNGTNWDITDVYTISASTGATFVVPRQAKFFRIVYTNGATNQGVFRLQTILNRGGTAPSSQRPSDGYTNQTDLVQNQVFPMGYNGTTWDRLRTTGTGVLTVSSVLTAGAAVIGSLTANQSVNVAQINGVAPLMGNGISGTGAQRVTVASDNTPFPVKVDQTTPGTTNAVSLAQIGATTVVNGGVAGTLAVGGVTAAAASSTGNPVRVGMIGRTTNPTAVTDGQVANAVADKLGKQVVVGSLRDLKNNQITTITASVAETTIVTSVTSVFVDLYGIIITNTSATAVNVAIKDATAGTTRFNIAVPAGDTRGFMLNESAAIKQTAVTNNWTATVSASVTSVIITALTVQNL